MPWNPDKTGTLIGPKGKPVFLTGSITGRYSIELIQKNGHYAELWSSQVNGFISENED